MKKQLAKTKCTVKLRKSEYHKEWYLILESYPVFVNGKKKRIVEALNRTVTTPIWDKTRTARTTAESKTYKPKRDANGIIQCKRDADINVCIYADNYRKLRQREYDNADLYTEKEAELAEQNEKQQVDFIAYFIKIAKTRHKKSSQSIIINWNRVCELLKIFTEQQPLPFVQINLKKCEDFRQFLLDAPQGGNKSGTISQNTASTYFSIFKAALKQAFIDGYFASDISAKLKGISINDGKNTFETHCKSISGINANN